MREDLQKRLGALNEKVNMLGGPPTVAEKDHVADRVGSVLFSGFPEKELERVRGIVTKAGLRPGDGITKAAIEDARGKLDKGGFKGSEVVTIRSDTSPGCSDVTVRGGSGKSR